MAALTDLLRTDQINLNLRGTDKNSVLGELVSLVPELAHEPGQREQFLQNLLERERLHTTGIGDGIALPHARNPLGGLLKRSIVSFGRHLPGIEYGALDGRPVQLFFLIASPNLTEHLAVLARISRVLRDQKLRTDLLSLADGQRVLDSVREAEARTIR